MVDKAELLRLIRAENTNHQLAVKARDTYIRVMAREFHMNLTEIANASGLSRYTIHRALKGKS